MRDYYYFRCGRTRRIWKEMRVADDIIGARKSKKPLSSLGSNTGKMMRCAVGTYAPHIRQARSLPGCRRNVLRPGGFGASSWKIFSKKAIDWWHTLSSLSGVRKRSDDRIQDAYERRITYPASFACRQVPAWSHYFSAILWNAKSGLRVDWHFEMILRYDKYKGPSITILILPRLHSWCYFTSIFNDYHAKMPVMSPPPLGCRVESIYQLSAD